MEKKEKLERGSKMISDKEFKKLCEERAKWPIRAISIKEIKQLTPDSLESFINNNLLYPLMDKFLSSQVSDNKKDFWYIGYQPLIPDYDCPLHDQWKIQEIYQLGYFFDNIYFEKESPVKYPSFDYYLYHFTKDAVENVEIYYNPDRDEDYFNYYNGFSSFFKDKYEYDNNEIIYETQEVERGLYPTLRKGDIKLPPKLKKVIIPRKNFLIKYLNYLPRYREEVTDVFGFPDDNEKFDSLDKFVTFIEPDEKKGYSDVKEGVYITNYNIGEITDKIHHWIGSMGNHCVGVADTDEVEEVIAIFHCDDKVIQKYLFAYLGEENRIAIDFYKYGYCPFGKSFKHWGDYNFERENIKHLPVIIPSGDLSKYQFYVTPSLLSKNLLLNTISDSAHDKKIKEIMARDMEEVVTCYEHGAYKAAIVLTGALLEAFLFDWLYELYGQDFFNEGKYPISRYGVVFTRVASNLGGYIKALQERYHFKNPPWDDENSPPNKIRKKRNYIHPKNFFNVDESVINEDSCKEVYTYLNYIVNWRFDHAK